MAMGPYSTLPSHDLRMMIECMHTPLLTGEATYFVDLVYFFTCKSLFSCYCLLAVRAFNYLICILHTAESN